MSVYKNTFFEGERPLFAEKNAELIQVKFYPGESALKHSVDIQLSGCEFMCKYPLWHSENITLSDSLFTVYGRAAIWYTKNLTMEDCRVDAPKMFRECDGLFIRRSTFPNAEECLWNCRNITMQQVEMGKADYVFMNASHIEIEDFKLQGNYSFQGAKNITVRNAHLKSKDAFWHAENVTVYDSVLDGEYLGWHSQHLTLINCTISGEQPLCYAHNLVMKNCSMQGTDLCFEYSTLQADISGDIISVKNPAGGSIRAASIGEIIIDEHCINPGACKITLTSDKELAGCEQSL